MSLLPHYHAITLEELAEARTMHASGFTTAAIARWLGVARGTIRKALQDA